MYNLFSVTFRRSNVYERSVLLVIYRGGGISIKPGHNKEMIEPSGVSKFLFLPYYKFKGSGVDADVQPRSGIKSDT